MHGELAKSRHQPRPPASRIIGSPRVSCTPMGLIRFPPPRAPKRTRQERSAASPFPSWTHSPPPVTFDDIPHVAADKSERDRDHVGADRELPQHAAGKRGRLQQQLAEAFDEHAHQHEHDHVTSCPHARPEHVPANDDATVAWDLLQASSLTVPLDGTRLNRSTTSHGCARARVEAVHFDLHGSGERAVPGSDELQRSLNAMLPASVLIVGVDHAQEIDASGPPASCIRTASSPVRCSSEGSAIAWATGRSTWTR